MVTGEGKTARGKVLVMTHGQQWHRWSEISLAAMVADSTGVDLMDNGHMHGRQATFGFQQSYLDGSITGIHFVLQPSLPGIQSSSLFA